MKIEIGKKYRTRGGWMAEVIGLNPVKTKIWDNDELNLRYYETSYGYYYKDEDKSPYDLMAPWEEEKTTRKKSFLELCYQSEIEEKKAKKAVIRRQYACAALQGLLAKYPLNPSGLASSAFEIADAMMALENDSKG